MPVTASLCGHQYGSDAGGNNQQRSRSRRGQQFIGINPRHEGGFAVLSWSARVAPGIARVWIYARSFAPITKDAMQIKDGGLGRDCSGDGQSQRHVLDGGV